MKKVDISLESFFVFDCSHSYWPVSQKVFWQLTVGFVVMGTYLMQLTVENVENE